MYFAFCQGKDRALKPPSIEAYSTYSLTLCGRIKLANYFTDPPELHALAQDSLQIKNFSQVPIIFYLFNNQIQNISANAHVGL